MIREFLRKNRRLRLERLPAYAPDLNPVEAVWGWLKWGRLANFVPDELAERSDLQRALTQAISRLPPAYAEVVALRYAGDRSFAEIAEILGCDEGAARVRFHRAKGLLRRELRALTG